LRQENQSEQSPFNILGRTAPILILRGFVIGGLQYFAKTAIVAQAGESTLDAYGVYGGIENIAFILGFRGFRIISAHAAQLHAEDPIEMGVLYRRGVMFAGVLMIPSGLLCMSAPAIFEWTRQTPFAQQSSRLYFLCLFPGILCDSAYRTLARIHIGRSQPLSALIGDMVECTVDVLLTWLLINKMGVAGASAAYTISAAITALGYNIHTYLHPDFQKYQLYNFTWDEIKKTFDSSEFKKMLFDGMYIAFKFGIVNITALLTTFLCSSIGPGALTGLKAASAYGYFVSLPIGGFSEAASVLVGRLYKTNWNEAKKVGNFTITASCAFASVCAGLLFTFTDPIARLFVSDDAAHANDFQAVKTFLRIQSIMEIANSIANSGASVLSGCLQTRYAFLLSVACIFVLNTLVSVLSYFKYSNDATNLYAAQFLGLFCNAAGILWKWGQEEKPVEINTTVAMHTMWQKPVPQVESPRHVAVTELLPI